MQLINANIQNRKKKFYFFLPLCDCAGFTNDSNSLNNRLRYTLHALSARRTSSIWFTILTTRNSSEFSAWPMPRYSFFFPSHAMYRLWFKASHLFFVFLFLQGMTPVHRAAMFNHWTLLRSLINKVRGSLWSDWHPPWRLGHWAKWKILLIAKWRGMTGLIEKERK